MSGSIPSDAGVSTIDDSQRRSLKKKKRKKKKGKKKREKKQKIEITITAIVGFKRIYVAAS